MPVIVKKRCAIYCRKSVEEGLDQEFNSLDAQREAAEAFILSQKANGWVCLPKRYDDGGFSGGNTKRPALQELLDDCEAGLVDMIVVYKIVEGVLILRNSSLKLKMVVDNAILLNYAVSSESISERIKIQTENGFYLKQNVCIFRRNENRTGK